MASRVIRRRVVVRGTVQGVSFRDATQRAAASLGVSGWVRNRSDGAVEALFEGPVEAVEQAVDRCRSGPPAARVEAVEVSEEEPGADDLEGFEIR